MSGPSLFRVMCGPLYKAMRRPRSCGRTTGCRLCSCLFWIFPDCAECPTLIKRHPRVPCASRGIPFTAADITLLRCMIPTGVWWSCGQGRRRVDIRAPTARRRGQSLCLPCTAPRAATWSFISRVPRSREREPRPR